MAGSDGIEFYLRFNDLLTGPMKQISASLTSLDSTLKQVNNSLNQVEKSEREVANVTKEASGFLDDLSSKLFGTVTAATLVADAIETVISTVVNATKAVADFAFQAVETGYQARIAFQALAGSVAQGNANFQEMERTARDTALPIQQVSNAMLGLREAGVHDDWIRPLVALSADLHVLKPDASFQQITKTLEQLATRGQITGRELRTLATIGISPEMFQSNETFKQLRKELEQHPLGFYDALSKISQGIREVAHENVLGALSFKSADSISGSIQRLKNEFSDMFNSVDDGVSGPMADLRKSFSELASLFDPTTDSGKEFEKTLSLIVDQATVFIKSLVSNKDEIAASFKTATDSAKAFLDILEAMKPVLDAIVFVINKIGGSALVGGGAGAGVGALVGSVVPVIGTGLGAGLGGGIGTLLSHPANDTSGWLGGVPTHLAGGGIVDSPTVALIGEAGPEAVVPLSGGGAGFGGVNAPVSINVHVEAGKLDEPLNEQILAEKMRELLPEEINSALEKITATAGAM